MPLRNVPITYTHDQQRQEINALAGDVNDIDTTFNERVDDRVGTLIVGGVGIASTYDDAGGTVTLDVAFNEFSTSNCARRYKPLLHRHQSKCCYRCKSNAGIC